MGADIDGGPYRVRTGVARGILRSGGRGCCGGPGFLGPGSGWGVVPGGARGRISLLRGRVRAGGLGNIEHSTSNVQVVGAESCGLRRFIAALLSVGWTCPRGFVRPARAGGVAAIRRRLSAATPPVRPPPLFPIPEGWQPEERRGRVRPGGRGYGAQGGLWKIRSPTFQYSNTRHARFSPTGPPDLASALSCVGGSCRFRPFGKLA